MEEGESIRVMSMLGAGLGHSDQGVWEEMADLGSGLPIKTGGWVRRQWAAGWAGEWVVTSGAPPPPLGG
jgi:hypothetical protein